MVLNCSRINLGESSALQSRWQTKNATPGPNEVGGRQKKEGVARHGQEANGGYLQQPLTKNSNTIIPLSEWQDQQIEFDNGLLHDIKSIGTLCTGRFRGGVNTCYVIIAVTQQIRRTLSRQVKWIPNSTIQWPR